MPELKGTLPFDTIRLEMDNDGRYRMHFAFEGKDLYYVEVPMPVRGKSLTILNIKGEMPWSAQSYG